MMPTLLRGDARALPLADESVDLVVTSPPYFGLRDYGTAGQIGAEPTPAEFLAALLDATREMVRVLKPSGSIFVNLGDKYAADARGPNGSSSALTNGAQYRVARNDGGPRRPTHGVRKKSLELLPERYRVACVDDLGLIARAVIVWSKPNGLPESVTDRVRRSHEDWVHLTKAPRYFSAVDEIRESYDDKTAARYAAGYSRNGASAAMQTKNGVLRADGGGPSMPNPLGKLPGSVWEIATQPLRVPVDLEVDHFAAFPMEWPRRLIKGWCPREVCTACGTARAPVAAKTMLPDAQGRTGSHGGDRTSAVPTASPRAMLNGQSVRTITGYACACSDISAPSTPGVVLDPFGGTGTTALVATMLGRRGISVDLSADYGRLAQWRAADPKERARAAGLDPDAVAKVHREIDGQGSLLDLLAAP